MARGAEERGDIDVKRRTWHIFCVLSLLILATSVMLWVRSYSVMDRFQLTQQPTKTRLIEWEIVSSRGVVEMGRTRSEFVEETRSDWIGWVHFEWDGPWNLYEPRNVAEDRMEFHFVGIQFKDTARTTNSHKDFYLYLILPLWLFLIFALPPLLWWRKWRKAGRRGFPVEPSASAGEGAGAGEVKGDGAG